MKTHEGAEVLLHSLLTSALDGVSGQFHAPVALSLRKETHDIR